MNANQFRRLRLVRTISILTFVVVTIVAALLVESSRGTALIVWFSAIPVGVLGLYAYEREGRFSE